MSPGPFTIDLGPIIRRAELAAAETLGRQLHDQAQTALSMAARETEVYGRRLLAEDPTITTEAMIEKLAAHLRSLITTFGHP